MNRIFYQFPVSSFQFPVSEDALDPFESYRSLNARLAGGEALYLRPSQAGWDAAATPGPGFRRVFYPRIGLYTGEGSSHSWLWFVELFDRIGFYGVSFLDEEDVRQGGLDKVDVFAVSGGDTFAVARALGAGGAKAIQRFVEGGGLYWGSCAGAYLPMNSSKKPLDLFNFASVKIANRSRTIPRAVRMSHKLCMAYGCEYIFHPVRETVKIRTSKAGPFLREESFEAPMYGGPSMIPSQGCEVLASYEDFTARTLFLVDPGLAAETLLGKVAVVRVPAGSGSLVLCGPHLEHPRFPRANRMVADTIYRSLGEVKAGVSIAPVSEAPAGAFLRDLKGELSNARIAAAGMDLFPITWQIGNKVYEPEKIRVFMEAMWARMGILERKGSVCADGPEMDNLLGYARKATETLRRLKRAITEQVESTGIADEAFCLLRQYAMAFFILYFRAASKGFARGKEKKAHRGFVGKFRDSPLEGGRGV